MFVVSTFLKYILLVPNKEIMKTQRFPEDCLTAQPEVDPGLFCGPCSSHPSHLKQLSSSANDAAPSACCDLVPAALLFLAAKISELS